MGTYTVSFFGQDETDGYGAAEERLRKIIKFLINSKEYVEFLVDRESEFNIFVSNIIHNMASNPYIGNKTRVIMFPYTADEYGGDENIFPDFYDETGISEILCSEYLKASPRIRDHDIVDRSDLVVCYVTHGGEAYDVLQYAAKRNKNAVNIADSENYEKFIAFIIGSYRI